MPVDAPRNLIDNSRPCNPLHNRHGPRGGGGTAPNDASDLSAAELAAMAAMRELQQLAAVITIKATPEQIVFEDARGQRSYALDGKAVKMTVAARPRRQG